MVFPVLLEVNQTMPPPVSHHRLVALVFWLLHGNQWNRDLIIDFRLTLDQEQPPTNQKQAPRSTWDLKQQTSKRETRQLKHGGKTRVKMKKNKGAKGFFSFSRVSIPFETLLGQPRHGKNNQRKPSFHNEKNLQIEALKWPKNRDVDQIWLFTHSFVFYRWLFSNFSMSISREGVFTAKLCFKVNFSKMPVRPRFVYTTT